MKRIALVTLLAVAAVAGGTKRSVTFAPSWAAAVEEARALNLPIVVHSHGFFCPPCWGMHKAVLQGKKYVKFAAENTVEVITVSQLDKGLEAKDRKAETYAEKGQEFLVEWPGLTVEQLRALSRSKAATYNKTGGVPYTAVIDPHTLEVLQDFPGSTSSKSLMKAIAAHRKALEKKHGKSVSRKAFKRARDEADDVRALLKEGELRRALDACEKLAKAVARQPAAIRNVANKAADEAYAAAGRRLDELEALIGRGKGKDAARELEQLARALRGTKHEQRAKDLLAKAQAS